MFLQQALDLAVEHLKRGQNDDAGAILEDILVQEPKDPLALYLLGSIYLDKGNYATARILLEKATSADPAAPWAWHNLGICHKASQDMAKAEDCYMKALKLEPGRSDTMAMVSGCYVNRGKPEPAIEWADKSLAIDPDCPHAMNHKALALLEMERWEEGWDAWEHRWVVPERAKMARKYPCEKWDGKPMKGTLVVHGEQGLGDEILYMTCWDDLVEAAGPECDIVIESASRLVPLFRRSFKARVYGTEQEVMYNEKPDAWLSMGSLPAMFRRSEASFQKQPNSILKADPARVQYYRDLLDEMSPGIHVGLAWWGGLAKTHSKVRNAPVKMWRPLVDEGTISVQYNTGDTADEAKAIGVRHIPAAVRDFDELTSLIAACDLIISVCQTAHHQAGGLGKPCWTLVPNAPAWRYGLEGDHNIWYPSVRQFRQQHEWKPVFDRVKKELAEYRTSQRLAAE